MDERTETAYSPKEMSTTLGVGDSTLRKWCIALEKNGYVFIRNDQNSRIYVESDLVVLRHFQNLVKQHNMQLENAAILVIDRFGKGAIEASTGIVLAEKEDEQRDLDRSNDVAELKEILLQQNELIKNLVSRMDQQQKYIEERLEQRDQLLLESIRESQETKRLIAAAQEEDNKKGFLARLFGK